MHYYKFNIGDYRRDTGHLTMLEHGAYRQLLDSYYLNEKPLPLDDAILMRTHSARNADEMQAIRNALQDFFIRTDEGWIHNHCNRVICEYHSKSAKAKDSANARWGNKHADVSEQDANAMRTHSEGNANHKPLTINHKPLTNNQEPVKTTAPKKPARFDPRDLPMPLGLKAATWGEWVSFRTKLPKPPKPETWEKQVEFLAKQIANGADAGSIVDYSIRNGYTGLFEPKQQPTKTQFLTAQQQRDENNRRSTADFLADDTPFFSHQGQPIEGECSNA